MSNNWSNAFDIIGSDPNAFDWLMHNDLSQVHLIIGLMHEDLSLIHLIFVLLN